MSYVSPRSGLDAFTCPHCGVFAEQRHFLSTEELRGSQYSDWHQNPVRVSWCRNCEKICLWFYDQMVFPQRGIAPPPNPHMPEDVLQDYEEAAAISIQSPRGAAALLRLAIQKLCKHLGGAGKNINDDIACLVREGLPGRVQQALDVVRVVGNNAVHPGQIVVEGPEVVGKLFELLNLITEYMVSLPHRVGILYDELPTTARQAIELRDR